MTPDRAFVLLGSGRKLDLLNPDPQSWTDEDVAVGLARTYRWGGHSRWGWPLSMAQHSLLVLTIYEQLSDGPPTDAQLLREVLHDSDELVGFDPILPIRPHLGPAFAAVTARIGAAVAERYRLPAWTPEEHALHKRADRLAAASEARHVAGWSLAEMHESLGISLDPLEVDPLLQRYGAELPAGTRPWEPWPAKLAAQLFLHRLQELANRAGRAVRLAELAAAFSRLPAPLRARCSHAVTGTPLLDTLVQVEAGDHSGCLEGVIVAGERDADGAWDLDARFTVFSTDDTDDGELVVVHGHNCLIEML